MKSINYIKNVRYAKNVRNVKNVGNVLHIFYHFFYKTFLQDFASSNLLKVKQSCKNVWWKNINYVKNVRYAKNVWSVLHIFIIFSIKYFCKIFQVQTCWNLKNRAKTFDGKILIYKEEKYELCKECKVCEECEEWEECGECVTHI